MNAPATALSARYSQARATAAACWHQERFPWTWVTLLFQGAGFWHNGRRESRSRHNAPFVQPARVAISALPRTIAVPGEGFHE